MSIVAQLVIILGISIFLIGYWFLGKNTGLQECNQEKSILSDTYKGGALATGIGLLLMVGGLLMFYRNSSSAGDQA
jgi:hypothetical protein